MLSDIFELFYARVRGHQYLQFIIHFVLLKHKFLPVLISNENVTLNTEISNYYSLAEAKGVLSTILHSVIYNPKTYLHKIDNLGRYEKNICEKTIKDKAKTEKHELNLFAMAVQKLNAKVYQTVEFLKDENA